MRVLIADDHRLVTDALAEYLKEIDPDVEVTKVETLDQAMESISPSGGFDLVLLDLGMPGMNGLEGLTNLRDRFPEVPVAMISGIANSRQILDAFSRGAVGFLLKNLSPGTIIRALELILSGEKYIPYKIVSERAVHEANTDGREKKSWEPGNPLNRLTAREREVLSFLVKGYSNQEIAREIGTKEITAAFHLRGVFKKLGASNRTQAAATALMLGWNGVIGGLNTDQGCDSQDPCAVSL